MPIRQAQRSFGRKMLIIGSGPIIIGQACEFDYSETQACKALRSMGYEIVLVNSNPATIMTGPGMADITYIELLNVNVLTEIIAKERSGALLPNLGGQTALNLSSELYSSSVLTEYGVKIIGVNIDAIERGEDRTVFKETMERLGIEMPRSQAVNTVGGCRKNSRRNRKDGTKGRRSASKYGGSKIAGWIYFAIFGSLKRGLEY